MTKIKSIQELSLLAARNKLVPFLGAGSSYGHLHLDWDEITSDMMSRTDCNGQSNLEVAEAYVKKFGKEGLCDFLKEKLLIAEYSENLDIVPLVVASLGVGLVYTTNQDNVFEKCAVKYGRRYRKIAVLEDLAAYLPGENLYVKYHGSLEYPSSIIFSDSSYKERINDVDHFLNIRMRSDLLTKNFLFIGYSFRDPNICQIFEELSAAFRGKLPQSFLVAFDYSEQLETLNKKYDVRIINPYAEIPGCQNNADAFEKYMTLLSEATCREKTSRELESLFKPEVPHATRVVSKFEIAGMKQAAAEEEFDEVLKLFRATFDASLIPETYHGDVAALYADLCKRCISRAQSDCLSGAAFNLHLNRNESIEVLAWLLTTSLHRGDTGSLDIFRPIVIRTPSTAYPFAAARAVELIMKWGLKMNDSFRRHATYWIEGYNVLPESVQSYIKIQMRAAWAERTTYENPISYWERLGHKSLFGRAESFENIQRNLMDMWPKAISKPYEE